MNALKAKGLSIPRDISVAGHDDLYFDLYPDIGLTTFHTPMSQIGRAAAALAVALMEHDDQIQPRQSFQPCLVVRTSTGPAPSRL